VGRDAQETYCTVLRTNTGSKRLDCMRLGKTLSIHIHGFLDSRLRSTYWVGSRWPVGAVVYSYFFGLFETAIDLRERASEQAQHDGNCPASTTTYVLKCGASATKVPGWWSPNLLSMYRLLPECA
jgi:hypothetical protein